MNNNNNVWVNLDGYEIKANSVTHAIRILSAINKTKTKPRNKKKKVRVNSKPVGKVSHIFPFRKWTKIEEEEALKASTKEQVNKLAIELSRTPNSIIQRRNILKRKGLTTM